MALNYLHSRNIVHRDIKLENVLMQTKDKDDLAIKITDFGFAKMFDPKRGLTDILGSPLYMAPEILLKKSYGTSVDIWASGVLLHILMVGEPPYIAESKKEIFELIKNKEVPFNKKLWENISPACTEFVMSMLNKNPEKRPTAA
jgi:serine/threonine protein kinase